MGGIQVYWLIFTLYFASADAANFDIRNNCPYTIWVGASPGGGRRLDGGQTWSLYVAPGTIMGRVWARTNCHFDGAGNGNCGKLDCTGWGTPPNTLAEYALNQYANLDFFDISLVDGFNVPMEFGPVNSNGCNTRGIRCSADINAL